MENSARKTFRNSMVNLADSYVKAYRREDYDTAARDYYRMVDAAKKMFSFKDITSIEFLRIMAVLKRYYNLLEKICE